MSQQGERPTRRPAQEDDWWGQLYEDAAADIADDTGPAPTADTLDDRFASAGAVTAPPGSVPAPRAPDTLRRPAEDGSGTEA
ncbi:hypothetical protein G3I40_22435, partial [Streptomyces sp. SID14478]|nr:hypothetical protein [Streptomyces sp. SID14478]